MSTPGHPDESANWLRAHTYRGTGMWERRLVRQASVAHAFAAVAKRWPDAPCVTQIRAGTKSRTVSYGELVGLVAARANSLRMMGIVPGTRIGLRPTNDIESLVSVLATLWTGAAVVLVNPRDAAERIRAQFGRVGAIDYEDLREQADARARDQASPGLRTGPECVLDAPAVVVFTSGSTGMPKAVAQSNYNVLLNCTVVANHHHLGPGVRLFACLPLFHVNALEFTAFGSLISGGQLFLADAFDPLSYLAALAESRAEIASVVPSILTALLGRGSHRQLPALRYFVSAAAPLATATVRQVWDHFGKRIVQGYGMSEAANFSAIMPPNLDADAYRRLMVKSAIPPVGPAIDGNEVEILTPEGVVAAVGESGEIGIRGHNVMLGYLDDRSATENAFRGGWLHTGDLGTKIADRALRSPMVVVTGRAKNMIKVAGHAIGLEEIERVLMDLVGVKAVAACGVPDIHCGEALATVLVASPNVDGVAVRTHVRRRIGPDQVPSVIRFVDQLPALANGKLAREEVVRIVSTSEAQSSTTSR